MSTQINEVSPYIQLIKSTIEPWKYRKKEADWGPIDNNILEDTVPNGTQQITLKIKSENKNQSVTVTAEQGEVSPSGVIPLRDDFQAWTITVPSNGNTVTVTPTDAERPVLTLKLSIQQ